jgi:hypothetical protein
MNYSEIISHIARRLGHQAFANSLKADYRYALKWAESEMVNYIDVVRKVVTISMNPTQAGAGNAQETVYPLPPDYCHPRQFRFVDSNNNEIQAVEVEVEEFLRWNPNPDVPPTANDFLPQQFTTDMTVDNARLGNRIVFCCIYDNTEGWTLRVKPTTTGKIELYYVPDSNLDIFDNLESTPPFPDNYHHYLISGAIKYLADVEASQKRAAGDYQGASFFIRIGKDAATEWERVKEVTRQESSARSTMPTLKAFSWFDNPRRYR